MRVTTIKDAYDSALRYYTSRVKRDAQEINQNWFSSTKREATTRLNKLSLAKSTSQGIVNAMQWKSSSALTKHYKEQKEYAQLLAEYSKSYIFIQSVRKDITKENMQYLLNLHSVDGSNSQSIYVVSLKDLLPALEMTVNRDKSFALAIKNVEALKKLATDRAKIESVLSEKILDLSKQISNSVNAVKKEGQWIYGLGGIAFESAVRKLADGLINGKTPNDIQGSWEDFEKDTQVFYKAGDLSKEQVEKLFGLKNTVMELKRISLKANSVGAGVAKDKTIESALEAIKSICSEGFSSEAQRKLQELFSDSKGGGQAKKRQTFIQREEENVKKIVDNVVLTAATGKKI